MPASATDNACLHAERLTVPWHWWLVALVLVAVGGAEVFAGFDWHVALIVYAGLGLPALALLVAMSRPTVRVDADGIHAGGRTLPPGHVGEIRVLDRRATRLLLGPQADPAAHLVARGWIPGSVAVRTTGDDPAPYWLLSSRRPEELAAAIAQLSPRASRT